MSDRVKDQLEVFSGNSNPALAREVTEHLGVHPIEGAFDVREIRAA